MIYILVGWFSTNGHLSWPQEKPTMREDHPAGTWEVDAGAFQNFGLKGSPKMGKWSMLIIIYLCCVSFTLLNLPFWASPILRDTHLDPSATWSSFGTEIWWNWMIQWTVIMASSLSFSLFRNCICYFLHTHMRIYTHMYIWFRVRCSQPPPPPQMVRSSYFQGICIYLQHFQAKTYVYIPCC